MIFPFSFPSVFALAPLALLDSYCKILHTPRSLQLPSSTQKEPAPENPLCLKSANTRRRPSSNANDSLEGNRVLSPSKMMLSYSKELADVDRPISPPHTKRRCFFLKGTKKRPVKVAEEQIIIAHRTPKGVVYMDASTKNKNLRLRDDGRKIRRGVREGVDDWEGIEIEKEKDWGWSQCSLHHVKPHSFSPNIP